MGIVVNLGLTALVLWLTDVKLEVRSLLLAPAFVGLALVIWSSKVNPVGAKAGPSPIPSVLITTGPYRALRHPMYVGQGVAVAFFMWYAAGFWAAFALAVLAEIVFREYIWREEGSRPHDVPSSIPEE